MRKSDFIVIYRYYHNYNKVFRVKERKENSQGPKVTHAEVAGMAKKSFETLIEKMKGRRFFLHKLEMDEEDRTTWLQKGKNPGRTKGGYIPKYIYA